MIEFVTDGRIYEPSGEREGQFIIVFGALVAGPSSPASGTLVTPFLAEVRRPGNSEPALYQGQLDFPVADEPGEGPCVLLYGALPEELPAGCRITSRSSG